MSDLVRKACEVQQRIDNLPKKLEPGPFPLLIGFTVPLVCLPT